MILINKTFADEVGAFTLDTTVRFLKIFTESQY